MFCGAAAFNRDIGGWAVGVVEYNVMTRMFEGAAALNQDIGGSVVGTVRNMHVPRRGGLRLGHRQVGGGRGA